MTQTLDERLSQPGNRKILESLLRRLQNDPEYFFYLQSSIEHSLPKELGFDERVVRMVCDTCALNPLNECKFMDALLSVLKEHAKHNGGS